MKKKLYGASLSWLIFGFALGLLLGRLGSPLGCGDPEACHGSGDTKKNTQRTNGLYSFELSYKQIEIAIQGTGC